MVMTRTIGCKPSASSRRLRVRVSTARFAQKETRMQLGMIGLGRMGAGMVRRLLRGGHQCIVYERNPEAVAALVGEGAIGASSLEDFVDKWQEPRAVWLMVPAAVVDKSLNDLAPLYEGRRHCHRRPQLVLHRRYQAGQRPPISRHSLRRCRDERRSLGHGAWLLSSDNLLIWFWLARQYAKAGMTQVRTKSHAILSKSLV